MKAPKELRPSKNLNCNLKIKSQKYHFLNKNVLHTDLKALVELSDLIVSHKDKQRMQKHNLGNDLRTTHNHFPCDFANKQS